MKHPMFEFELERLNERLEETLKVLSAIDGSDEYEHSYPYGVGYAKSSVWATLQTIRTWRED